jgi:hypothetical protein
MKCPKCSYISFDFNQVCPKCNKDIAVEQAKLHIPSFRPEAPTLLGALIGEADDSSTGVAVDTSTGIDSGELDFEDSGTVDSGELSFEDSGALDSGDVGFDDSEDLDMGFESEGEPTEGVVSAFDSAELEPSSGDVEIATEESVTDFELGGDETALSMDSGEFPTEAGAASATEPEPATEEGELEIDLEDLSLDDSGLGDGVEMDEPVAEAQAADTDLESLASELDDVPELQEAELAAEEEYALDLDAEPLTEEELAIDLDAETPTEEELAIDLDAETPTEEELAIDLDAETPAEEELAIDLDAEPVPGGDEEVTLDLGDLKTDDSGELQLDTGAEVEELEKGLEADQVSPEEAPTEGATPEQIDGEEMDIDLDALSAELEGSAGQPGEGGDLSLDLDDLELELDLDEPEPKSS